MLDIIIPPSWFQWKDIFIDIISVIVLFWIVFFSLRSYKINHNKNYLALALSFSLLALSFILRILINFLIYDEFLEIQQLNHLELSVHVQSITTLVFLAVLFYRVFQLLGLYTLYLIYDRQSKPTVFLFTSLLLVLTYFTNNTYYIFHLTSFFLLLFITRYFFQQYKQQKRPLTLLLVYGLSTITLSHVVFSFVQINPLYYAFGEIVQLLGYTILLFTFIKVLRHGKKKK